MVLTCSSCPPPLFFFFGVGGKCFSNGSLCVLKQLSLQFNQMIHRGRVKNDVTNISIIIRINLTSTAQSWKLESVTDCKFQKMVVSDFVTEVSYM